MIERSRFDTPRIGEHLTPGAQPVIRELGVDRHLASGSHAPCAGIHSAWGSDDLYVRDYMFSVYGHGWNLDRARFDAALARLAEEAGATVLLGTQLSEFHAGDHGWIGCLKGEACGDVTVKAGIPGRRDGPHRRDCPASQRSATVAGPAGRTLRSDTFFAA